ncbi:MAG: four helix bundle protein [Nitrospira sp.]|nr:four helix bundle protein [Nitrospira sp.]
MEGSVREIPEKSEGLAARTKAFALLVVRQFYLIPKTIEGQIIGKQLLRSGTSVGAHYREACRARSRAEFISKLEAGMQELEESMYWIELLSESAVVPANKLEPLQVEANKLMGQMVTSVKTAKKKNVGS